MAWIDYRKACDLLPHSWILEMLEKVNVAGNVEGLLTRSMNDWKILLTSNGEMLGDGAFFKAIFYPL